MPGGIDRQNDLVTAEVLHRVRGGEDRLVLGRGHRDAEWASAVACGKCGADDREIVRLRAAGRKHHLIRLGPDRGGHQSLRLLDSGARRTAKPMGGRGIAESFLPQIWKHRVQHLRPNRRGRRVIEIGDALGHGASNLI